MIEIDTIKRQEPWSRFGPELVQAITYILLEEINEIRKMGGVVELDARDLEERINYRTKEIVQKCFM